MIAINYKGEDLELIQCVLKVEDVGNATDFLGLEEENTDYLSQYDVDVEYQDSDLGRSTVYYTLAYHTEEEPDFYMDEEGNPLEFDNV